MEKMDSEYNFLKFVLEEPEGEKLLLGAWNVAKDYALSNLILTGKRRRDVLNIIPSLEFNDLNQLPRTVKMIVNLDDLDFVKAILRKINFPAVNDILRNGVTGLINDALDKSRVGILRYIIDLSRNNNMEAYFDIFNEIIFAYTDPPNEVISDDLVDLIIHYIEMDIEDGGLTDELINNIISLGITNRSISLMRYGLSKTTVIRETATNYLAAVVEEGGFYEGVKFLLENGADVNTIIGDGNYRILDVAIQHSYLDIADLILSRMTERKILRSGVIPMDVRTIAYVFDNNLLQYNVDESSTQLDDLERLALNSIKKNRLDILKYLTIIDPGLFKRFIVKFIIFEEPPSPELIKFLTKFEILKSEFELSFSYIIKSGSSDSVRSIISYGLALPKNSHDILRFYYTDILKEKHDRLHMNSILTLPEDEFITLNEISLNHGVYCLRPSSNKYPLFQKQQKEHNSHITNELSVSFQSRDIVRDLMRYIEN